MAAGRGSAAARKSTAHRRTRRGWDGMGSVDGCFTKRLRELGWREGDNLAIEYRWAQGRSDRVSEFAAEFERRKVDVIVTYGAAVTILKQTITSIPIVFAVAFDPVRSGLVQSLAHPAGNVTGISIQQPDLVGKRL